MKRHKVVCEDCNSVFLTSTRTRRCNKCKDKTKYPRQRKYWSHPSRDFGDANHDYYALVKDFTKDELVALVSINRNKLKHSKDFREQKEIKSCIKICTELYKIKSQDQFEDMARGRVEDSERKILVEQVGMLDY